MRAAFPSFSSGGHREFLHAKTKKTTANAVVKNVCKDGNRAYEIKKPVSNLYDGTLCSDSRAQTILRALLHDKQFIDLITLQIFSLAASSEYSNSQRDFERLLSLITGSILCLRWKPWQPESGSAINLKAVPALCLCRKP